MAAAMALLVEEASPTEATAMMVETVDARAESGAMAAPTFIHPRASSSREPPTMMPMVGLPRAIPVRVQATSGRWNCRSSRTLAIPATNATSVTRMIWIRLMSCTVCLSHVRVDRTLLLSPPPKGDGMEVSEGGVGTEPRP